MEAGDEIGDGAGPYGTAAAARPTRTEVAATERIVFRRMYRESIRGDINERRTVPVVDETVDDKEWTTEVKGLGRTAARLREAETAHRGLEARCWWRRRKSETKAALATGLYASRTTAGP